MGNHFHLGCIEIEVTIIRCKSNLVALVLFSARKFFIEIHVALIKRKF